jgi:hypothetical protein
MAAILVISVEMNDESDLDWLRERCVPAVENAVDQAQEEGRLDSTSVEVTWDVEYPEENLA